MSFLNGFSNNTHSSKLILVATSRPSVSPSPIPPPLSFFPHSPPSFPARGSAVIGWIELLSAECTPSVTILVAGEWNGIKLPNWAIKGYFHPCTSVSVGSCSKYRSGTSDANETHPPFRWFKSTYVISSSHQQELAIPYHLGLVLQLSHPVITVIQTQACGFTPAVLGGQVHEVESGSTGAGAMCFHLDVEHKSKKNMLGVTYKFQPVSCHSSAQCREGGDKSLSHFVSEADTNRVAFHVTDAAHTGPC